MKKIATGFLLLAAVAVAAAAPRVSRASLRAMEDSLDQRISRLWTDVPYLLIGPTRGVYLDGYGAVFTAEVHLVADRRALMAAAVSKADVAQAHQQALDRIPMLKKALREALVSTAASLDTVPAQEQVSIVAFLDHYAWEDPAGMPSQVMVSAPKGKLLEAQRAGNADSVIQVTEN